MKQNNTLNTTELMTGKDGRLFVDFEDNGLGEVFLAEINTYSVNMNVNTTEKQPVGSIVVHRIPTGVTYDLTFTEMVVRDDVIMAPLLAKIKEGKIPHFNFRGVAYKPDGTAQQYGFNNCVPNGTFGIQNLTPGEVIEREQSFAINSIPEILGDIIHATNPIG